MTKTMRLTVTGLAALLLAITLTGGKVHAAAPGPRQGTDATYAPPGDTLPEDHTASSPSGDTAAFTYATLAAEEETSPSGGGAYDASLNGLKKAKNGQYYYYVNGVPIKDKVRKIGSYYYYFKKNGRMAKNGFYKTGGHTYYAGKNGRLVTNKLKKIGSCHYYFQKNGRMVKDKIVKNGSYRYYFKKNGRMAKNSLCTIGEDIYFFEKDGKMVTNRLMTLGQYTYCFLKNGKAARNMFLDVGDDRWYFDENGHWIPGVKEGDKPQGGKVEDDPKAIWNTLQSWTGNAYGTAALMGNLEAESGLRSNNLQNTYNKQFNVSDEEYTAQVDAGTRDFIDSAGYGLAQWTYYSRKQALKRYSDRKGTSIGDLYMQIGFLEKEISSDYGSVLHSLKNAKSVREASDVILTVYERPADMGEGVRVHRASLGEKYYNRYAGK